ncbi:hypothetical protein QZH41_004252 [Actinostola sp. cb2023]|nr:hypothetical protein QZH41_004252 [Actinostola sp. cb2023]
MDSSGSMTTIQYLQQKRFIQHLTRKFKIARDGTRVGIIVYSTRASIAISLKSYFTWRGFARAVSRIRFERGDTRIDLALKSAREIFKTSRGSREGVPKILIILTDGQQSMVKRIVVGRIILATQYPIRLGMVSSMRRYFEGRVTCLQIYGAALNANQISAIKKRCSAPQLPATRPPGVTGSPVQNPDIIVEIIEYINVFRRLHGVAPVIISDEIRIGIVRGQKGRYFVVVYYDEPGNKKDEMKDNVFGYTAPCPKGFLEYKGSCYKYDTDKVTWDEAFKRSIAENATLLSLNSLLEVDFLGMVLVSGRDGPAWIGLNDRQAQKTKTKTNTNTKGSPSAAPTKTGSKGTPSAAPTTTGSKGTPSAAPTTTGSKGTPSASPTTKGSSRPKLSTSIILKFGQGAKPDPTIPLQKAIKKNNGKFPAPVNEKASIKKITIVAPGEEPANFGSCNPYCKYQCMSTCNPGCCASKIATNAAHPLMAKLMMQRGMAMMQQRNGFTPASPQMGMGVQQPVGRPCIPTAANPCMPGGMQRTPFAMTPNACETTNAHAHAATNAYAYETTNANGSTMRSTTNEPL